MWNWTPDKEWRGLETTNHVYSIVQLRIDIPTKAESSISQKKIKTLGSLLLNLQECNLLM